MSKKRSVISYSNLSPELLKEFKNKYPYGYQNDVIKVVKPNGDFFHAVTMETDDAVYLVKVNVKIDSKIKDEDDEKEFFGTTSDDIGTDADSFDDIASDDDESEDEVATPFGNEDDGDDDM